MEATRTQTLVSIAFINATTAIFAGIGTALVHLGLAISAGISKRTIALKPQLCVFAGSVQARFFRASYRFFFAMFAHPAFVAFAFVTLGHFAAGAAILAGIEGAVASFVLAFASGEAGRTFARVETFAGVEASSAIEAGTMVGAVVEILIAEKTAPTFLADALPWGFAGAVNATRVGLAFVT